MKIESIREVVLVILYASLVVSTVAFVVMYVGTILTILVEFIKICIGGHGD